MLLLFWEVQILDQEVNEQFISLAWELLDRVARVLWLYHFSVFQSPFFPAYFYTFLALFI